MIARLKPSSARSALRWWENSQLHPALPRLELGWRIYAQQPDSCSSDFRESQYFSRSKIHSEVIHPSLLPRIEDRLRALCFGIDGINASRFPGVAGTARECTVLFAVNAAARSGSNVLDLQRKIEGHFRRETVLAAMRGSLGNPRIKRVHFSSSRASAAARFAAAYNSASTSSSSSRCSSLLNVVPASRAARHRSIRSARRACCSAEKKRSGRWLETMMSVSLCSSVNCAVTASNACPAVLPTDCRPAAIARYATAPFAEGSGTMVTFVITAALCHTQQSLRRSIP